MESQRESKLERGERRQHHRVGTMYMEPKVEEVGNHEELALLPPLSAEEEEWLVSVMRSSLLAPTMAEPLEDLPMPFLGRRPVTTLLPLPPF